MSNWERIPFEAQCDVPECPELAALCFLPVFESPGGWTGEGRWNSEDNIGFVCEAHYDEGQHPPGGLTCKRCNSRPAVAGVYCQICLDIETDDIPREELEAAAAKFEVR